MTATPTTTGSGRPAPGPGRRVEDPRASVAGRPDLPGHRRAPPACSCCVIMAGDRASSWSGKAVPALRVNTVNFLTTSEWFPDRPARADVRHRGAGLRHRRSPPSSRWSWRCRSARHRAVHRALRARGGWPRRSATSSTCWPRCRRSSTACGACSSWCRACVGLLEVARRPPRAGSRSSTTPSASTPGRSRSPRIVLAIMILPIISAISREVFLQVPRGPHRGGAGARRDPLGDDPDSRCSRSASPGMISAAMLGLGRALGETIAVALRAVRDLHRSTGTSPSRAATPSPPTSRCKFDEAGRRRPRRADRLRPGAVRHHAARSTWSPALVIERRREFSGAN